MRSHDETDRSPTRSRVRTALLVGLFPTVACHDSAAPASSSTTGAAVTTDAEPPTGAPDSDPDTGDDIPTAGSTATDGDVSTDTGADASSSTGATTGTSGVMSGCGDAIVDPDEACDLGVAHNWDQGACTSQCELARCGDGLVFAGVEACDDGEANAVGYGKCDPVTCQFGPRCGDGVDDPEEECDGGGPGGEGEIEGANTPCKAGCAWDGRVVFLSSAAYDGDLGGITGADLKCQVLAQAQQIHDPGRFKAWLSDADESPLSRLSFAPGRIVMPNGVLVAEDLAALIEDGPGDGITVTEQGDSVLKANVWTNTAVTGAPFSETEHCGNWTSADKLSGARQGRNAEPKLPPEPWMLWKLEKRWTSFVNQPCAWTARLYCIED